MKKYGHFIIICIIYFTISSCSLKDEEKQSIDNSGTVIENNNSDGQIEIPVYGAETGEAEGGLESIQTPELEEGSRLD